VPADYHPLALGKDDSLPARAGQTALASLYGTWTFLQETDREVSDKSKLTNIIASEMTKALERLDKSISYAAGQEKSYHEAITKVIAACKTAHANEIRTVLREKKLPLSVLIREAKSDTAVAAALHGIPSVLTGLKPDEQAALNDAIEATLAASSYADRASARRVHAKLTVAKERFGTTWMKRIAVYGNSDDVKLAERLKKRSAAA
jgi:ABC-type Na+ efflux pump permease subunit